MLSPDKSGYMGTLGESTLTNIRIILDFLINSGKMKVLSVYHDACQNIIDFSGMIPWNLIFFFMKLS